MRKANSGRSVQRIRPESADRIREKNVGEFDVFRCYPALWSCFIGRSAKIRISRMGISSPGTSEWYPKFSDFHSKLKN